MTRRAQVTNDEIEEEGARLPHEGFELRPSHWEPNPG
jgi:hypothetical protein